MLLSQNTNTAYKWLKKYNKESTRYELLILLSRWCSIELDVVIPCITIGKISMLLIWFIHSV